MAYQEARDRKRISIKAALRERLAAVTGAAAEATVISLAQAAFRAYVASLPCRTGITQFNAQIALQGWPGEVTGVVLHSAKSGAPILEHNEIDFTRIRKQMKKGDPIIIDDYRVAAARRKSLVNVESVQVAVNIKRGFAKRMAQSVKAGSKSKIKNLRITMWTHRMAYDEPVSAAVLAFVGMGNFSLTPFPENMSGSTPWAQRTTPVTGSDFATLFARFKVSPDASYFNSALNMSAK